MIFVSATMHYTGCALQSHVSVAKAGIDALSNTMAIELGPRGVTSNVIAPGPIAGTEGLERLAKKGGAAETAAAQAKIPVGRWGQVKDIADATVWLFSDAAGFVNGSTVVGQSRSLAPLPSVPGWDEHTAQTPLHAKLDLLPC